MDDQLINYLKEFVTPQRWDLFNRVIRHRTDYLTVVLEDIFQPQNASAVLRTCDCFGVQNVHIIENENQYQVNPDVALGSDKWLNLNYYNQPDGNATLSTFNALRNKGYRIVATTPHTNDISLEDFDLDKGKVALVFGTELRGLSKIALNNADEFLKIPMYGFTESLNISVSAAIILHHMSFKLSNSGIKWEIPADQKKKILIEWLKKSIKDSERIISNFLKDNAL